MQAFSLKELMVVIAIVSMLASAAVPAYGDYITRSRIASLMPVIESVKVDVMTSHNLGTTFGATTEVQIATGATGKPDYLDQLVRHNYGCIMVDYDLDQLGLESGGGEALELMLCPDASVNQVIVWNCGYSASTTAGYVEYLPNNCQVAAVTDTSF